MLSRQSLDRFIIAQRLPGSFRTTASQNYDPVAAWLRERLPGVKPFLLGINGAQGTGKSTLAAYLALSLRESDGHTAAVLSIDDFYLTKTERQRLSRHVHPLLAVRGVPGTHDVPMLRECIDRLRKLQPGERLLVLGAAGGTGGR